MFVADRVGDVWSDRRRRTRLLSVWGARREWGVGGNVFSLSRHIFYFF